MRSSGYRYANLAEDAWVDTTPTPAAPITPAVPAAHTPVASPKPVVAPTPVAAPAAPLSTDPWAIDAAKFHTTVDPMLRDWNDWFGAPSVQDSENPGSANAVDHTGQKYWASPEGQNGNVSFQLQGGKTWTPSGAGSGITYHPAGETKITGYTPLVDPTGNNGMVETGGVPIYSDPLTQGYYEVNGDLSALTGNAGSNSHGVVKYVEKNGQMVPMEDLSTWNYKPQSFLGGAINGLGPMANVALAIATAGQSLPIQIAANAAMSALKGNDIGDIFKNVAGTYLGAQIPGLDSVKSITGDLNSINPALGNVFNSALSSGTRAAVSGQSVLEAAITGGVAGGVNGGMKQLAGDIPGYSDMSPQTQQMLSNAATGLMAGKSLDQIALNSVMSLGQQGAQQADMDAFKASYTAPPPDILGQLNAAGLNDIADQYALGTVSNQEALQYLGIAPVGKDTTGPAADYSLTSATPIAPNSDPYALWTPNTPYESGVGLNPFKPSSSQLTYKDLVGKSPDLASMGGGQGLLAPTTDAAGNPGFMGSTGFTASNSQPTIGDPNSWINNPAITGQPVAAPSETQAPSPTVSKTPTTGGKDTAPPPSTTKKPANTSAAAPTNSNNMMNMLTLAGLLQQPQQQAPVQAAPADIKSMQNLWGAGIDNNFLTSNVHQFYDGGSIDDLLHLLRS